MANEFEDAFAELQAAFEDVTGEAQQVTIDGVDYGCVVTDITQDDMIVHGGVGNRGGFSVMVKKSDFDAIPDETTEIIYGDFTLQVVNVTETNGATYTIVAEDLSTK